MARAVQPDGVHSDLRGGRKPQPLRLQSFCHSSGTRTCHWWDIRPGRAGLAAHRRRRAVGGLVVLVCRGAGDSRSTGGDDGSGDVGVAWRLSFPRVAKVAQAAS
jgi:hypothetical protein